MANQMHDMKLLALDLVKKILNAAEIQRRQGLGVMPIALRDLHKSIGMLLRYTICSRRARMPDEHFDWTIQLAHVDWGLAFDNTRNTVSLV